MSDKIKGKMQAKDKPGEKTFTLSPQAITYMRNLETIREQVNIYLSQTQAAYLKVVSIDFGYKPEDNIRFKMDLNDDSRKLTFIEVKEEAA